MALACITFAGLLALYSAKRASAFIRSRQRIRRRLQPVWWRA